jgi:hypothetical protein
MRLANAWAVLVTCGLILGFGWFFAAHWDSAMETCLRRYGRARTAADTARVDAVWLGGKNPLNGYTCGLLRRDGTLDRHRAAQSLPE